MIFFFKLRMASYAMQKERGQETAAKSLHVAAAAPNVDYFRTKQQQQLQIGSRLLICCLVSCCVIDSENNDLAGHSKQTLTSCVLLASLDDNGSKQ